MKTRAVLAGLFSLVLLTSACASSEAKVTTKIMMLFQGKHSLQRLVQYNSVDSKMSGGGFFFLGVGAGSVSGETKTNYSVKFAWKSNVDEAFIISSVPLERVRVKFDESVTVPHVEFKLWCGDNDTSSECGGPDFYLTSYGQQRVIDEGYVVYVTITVKSNDWPLKIEMPLP